LLKFIVIFFLERYSRLKEKCRLLEKNQKYNQLKQTIDEQRIQELRVKAQAKIKKEIEKEVNNERSQNKKTSGPNQDMVRRYPEILCENTPEPKRILY
jgi:hypothetical protein